MANTPCSGAGGKNELVARGGSGGALALSRAPVGGSASPAPAPLPQPAPSPAPAALPPPALPPPPFRGDTPHRSNGAHIPALDGHAATQIPARPVSAAGPDTPERPASNNNKLQPCARASAESPTPAPPAPPAPSPLFPSHTAYQSQSHAASALPDYRLTNHETRTEPQKQPSPAPLDLHAHHIPRPPHIASTTTQSPLPSLPSRVLNTQPHPVMPGHDVRNLQNTTQAHPPVPTSLTSRAGVVPLSIASLSTTTTNTSCLPSHTSSGRPISPAAPVSRPFSTSSIGSSHVNSIMNTNTHGHPIPYQNQSSLQKHSVHPVYASRPSHLPFSVANHISSSQMQSSAMNQATVTHVSHPINSHSITNHTNLTGSNSTSLSTSLPNHNINNIGSSLALPSSTPSTISSYSTPSLKHPGLSVPQLATPLGIPVSVHTSTVNQMETSALTTAAPSLIPVITTTSNHLVGPLVSDSRPTPMSTNELSSRSDCAIVSSNLTSNGYPPPAAIFSGAAYPPLYAPYATTLQHSPYLPPAAASPRNSTDTVSVLISVTYA